jgi:hypothetical protein
MGYTEGLIPIFGMLTGVLVTGAIVWGVVQGLKYRYGGRLADPALAGEVAALRDQVEQMQHQLAEAQERIDFTERLLSQSRTPEQLPRSTR